MIKTFVRRIEFRFHLQLNLFEFWNLSFVIYLGFELWDLYDHIGEKKVQLNQYEYCKLNRGHNIALGHLGPNPRHDVFGLLDNAID
jgi:hypothetical protein